MFHDVANQFLHGRIDRIEVGHFGSTLSDPIDTRSHEEHRHIHIGCDSGIGDTPCDRDRSGYHTVHVQNDTAIPDSQYCATSAHSQDEQSNPPMPLAETLRPQSYSVKNAKVKHLSQKALPHPPIQPGNLNFPAPSDEQAWVFPASPIWALARHPAYPPILPLHTRVNILEIQPESPQQ